MRQLVHPGPEGIIFDAPNRGNLIRNDAYALNKKDTLHPARVIYDIVVRYIQRAGLEFCDAAYTITGFPALSIPDLIWVAMQGILEEKPGQSSL